MDSSVRPVADSSPAIRARGLSESTEAPLSLGYDRGTGGDEYLLQSAGLERDCRFAPCDFRGRSVGFDYHSTRIRNRSAFPATDRRQRGPKTVDRADHTVVFAGPYRDSVVTKLSRHAAFQLRSRVHFRRSSARSALCRQPGYRTGVRKGGWIGE